MEEKNKKNHKPDTEEEKYFWRRKVVQLAQEQGRESSFIQMLWSRTFRIEDFQLIHKALTNDITPREKDDTPTEQLRLFTI